MLRFDPGPAPLPRDRLCEFLKPYGVALDTAATERLTAYLALLMQWNARINLTAIRSPEAAVTRHFGESFLVARAGALHGRLLDIGSGAGFPGLALKIIYPALEVTLLEPIAKKKAFLLEASRICGFSNVTVRGERLEAFAVRGETFDAITARAVGDLESLAKTSVPLLAPSGRLFLWITRRQADDLPALADLTRIQEVAVPFTRERVIVAFGRNN